jgi:hypothetical protein
VILSNTRGNGVTGTLADKSSGAILNLMSPGRVIIGILSLGIYLCFFEFALVKGRVLRAHE